MLLTALALGRAHWKLALVGILVALLAVQSVRLGHRSNQLERAKINLNEARAELKRISTAKNKQGKATERNIDKAEQGEREAKPIADKIREAPIPPNCATPGLDIMRNEL